MLSITHLVFCFCASAIRLALRGSQMEEIKPRMLNTRLDKRGSIRSSETLKQRERERRVRIIYAGKQSMLYYCTYVAATRVPCSFFRGTDPFNDWGRGRGEKTGR